MRASLFVHPLALVLLLTGAAVAHGQDTPAGIKVAVITNETGAHLGAYFSGLARTKEAAAVVLADPDGNAEEQAREALGDKLTTVYKDRDEMLAAEKPAMALISMEARLAPAAIEAALDAGCHVLAEKPACVRAEDFAALVEKAGKTDRHLMLALTNRMNPDALKAKELMASGAIGDMYGIEIRMVKDQTRLTKPWYHDRWYADKARAGGGHLTWLGIHWLDLAMHVAGSSVTHVAGFYGNVGGQPVNIEDSANLALRFDNGAFGTMVSGYYTKSSLETLIRIWGSEGWLELSSDHPRQVRWLNTSAENPEVQVYDAPSHSTYSAYVEACVQASAGLREAPMTPAEALRVLRVIYGFYEAAESGKTVAVE